MSDHSGPIVRGKDKAKKYNLPRFSEEAPQPETKEYVFRPLAGGPQEVSLTYEEAERILARARSRAKAEAEGILKEAQTIRAAAQEKGLQQGLNQGRDQGRQELHRAFEEKVSSTLAVLEKINNLYEDLWQTNEALLVKLALKISERVVLHEVQTSGETIAETFKAAVEHIGQQHRAVFRLHPQDLENLEAVRTELRGALAGLRRVSFEADPDLSRGDLVMETESGRLDATIKRRIESVTEKVDEILRSKSLLER